MSLTRYIQNVEALTWQKRAKCRRLFSRVVEFLITINFVLYYCQFPKPLSRADNLHSTNMCHPS